MSLANGTRLGPYEITAPLGVGGMGEVYAANDVRLNRPVAIKVLPRELHLDTLARERFVREAHAVSALNHPHVCALYDIGQQGDIDFIVMELLEGETLAAHLARGPLSLAQALRCGADLAGALDAAHRHGIVHRDLKPANVILTKNGPKLLDFGLAKFQAPSARLKDHADGTTTAGTTSGTILGTVGYMSPEQVEGQAADARSDIWALGVVLYEMVTGRRAFTGNSPASILGAILRDDVPPLSQTQPLAPEWLDLLVRGALERDPERRWQSAADVEKILRLMGTAPSAPGPVPVPRWRWALVAGWLAATLVGAAWLYQRAGADAPRPAAGTVRFDVVAPDGTAFSMFGDVSGAWPMVSPDGTRLVFTAAEVGSAPRLFVRRLDSTDAHAIAGTDDAMFPFWAPDGQRIGYFAGNRLMTVNLDGGSPRLLAEVATNQARGGAWSQQGTILFAPAQVSGLMRINDDGTGLSSATTLDAAAEETSHRWPAFLPDGRHYVYTLRGQDAAQGVYLGDLDGAPPKRLLPDLTNAVVEPAGHLLFARAGVLLSQPFDVTRRELSGVAVAVAPRVAFSPSYYNGAFSVSSTGVLAYGASAPPTQLQWMNRRGEILTRIGPTGEYIHPRPSPDESKIVVARLDSHLSTYDVWIIDGSRGDTMTRLTYESASERFPVWSPDGRQVALSSQRVRGLSEILLKPASGGDSERLLVKRSDTARLTNFATDWSADGKTVLFLGQGRDTNWDIASVDVATGVASNVLQTRFVEVEAQLSSNGRWLAYSSDESGRFETYLRPFPSGDRKWQVSSQGGRQPRWRQDGRELFYQALDGTLMAVPIADGAQPEPGLPVPLFTMQVPELAPQFGRDYAVSRDGQRFLVNWMAEQGPRATVVVNWTGVLPAAPPR